MASFPPTVGPSSSVPLPMPLPASPGSGVIPTLSKTFQTSQLYTPLQLDRITIDDPHYCAHLVRSVAALPPPKQNALLRRTGKMGDKYFFAQKDIPVSQSYARTALKLSEIRPWDQIVERPLSSRRVIAKEVDLPFPQEHPYTSHISRFAVFPDTNFQQPPLEQSDMDPESRDPEGKVTNKVNVETQTGYPQLYPVGVPHPPTPYYVSQKAGEWGQRVECRYLSTPAPLTLEGAGHGGGVGNMLWDLPRSQRHKRAYTYPAPSLQYARPPTTPSYLPLPSTGHHTPSPLSSSTLSPHTLEALKTIHKRLTRTTTYSEQYSPRTPSTGSGVGLQNILQLDYLMCESQRPWTSESRGKYSRRFPITPLQFTPREQLQRDQLLSQQQEFAESTKQDEEEEKKRVDFHTSNTNHPGVASTERENQREQKMYPDQADSKLQENVSQRLQEGETADLNLNKPSDGGEIDVADEPVIMVDQGTQTEEQYFTGDLNIQKPIARVTFSQETARLPQLPFKNDTDNGTIPQERQQENLLPINPLTDNRTIPQEQQQEEQQNVLPINPLFLQTAKQYKLPQLAASIRGTPIDKNRARNRTLSSDESDRHPTADEKLQRPFDHAADFDKRRSYPPNSVSNFHPSARNHPVTGDFAHYPHSMRPATAPLGGDVPGQKLLMRSCYSARSTEVYTPRTVDSTRRLMGLYNGFSRTKILKKFNEQFEGPDVDLRQYSTREGKKHIIHGSHAYYFH